MLSTAMLTKIEGVHMGLPHHCNPLFLDCVRPSEYRCCKLNKLRVILDNTKHTFKHEGADPIISANLYLAVVQAVLPLGK